MDFLNRKQAYNYYLCLFQGQIRYHLYSRMNSLCFASLRDNKIETLKRKGKKKEKKTGYFQFACYHCFKSVFGWNNWIENEFDLHENECVGQTHFHINSFAPILILTHKAKGNSEMASCNQELQISIWHMEEWATEISFTPYVCL